MGGDAPTLARKLGLFDMTMLVMGSVIGAGIFVVPHTVADQMPMPAAILAAWGLGGILTLAGSLVYAELTRRRPHVGGQYTFLREAYHPVVSFVYGWSLLWIVQSGGMASVAVIFARYFLELVRILRLVASGLGWAEITDAMRASPEAPFGGAVVTTVAIGTLTAINCFGVRSGSTAQNIFMVLKVLAIVTLVVCGLLFAQGDWSVSREIQPAGELGGPWPGITVFAAAMVPVLFAYGGSHTTTFMAGEVRDPRRDLPRGLVLGVGGVIALYLAVNYVCLRVLGVDDLAVTESPASEVMRRTPLGGAGAAFISAGIAISALGFLSQATLTSPRVYYAMAKDGLFFRSVAWVHPRTRVPVIAVLLQGLFAMVIAVSGTFDQIVKFVMAVEMVFLALTALSLFVLRRRDAAAADFSRYCVPGHPATTLLFAGVNVALVLNLFYKDPRNSFMGWGIALVGVPVYFYWRRRSRPVDSPPSVITKTI
jgi:APA family basic amino acid/polyamine antiporter